MNNKGISLNDIIIIYNQPLCLAGFLCPYQPSQDKSDHLPPFSYPELD